MEQCFRSCFLEKIHAGIDWKAGREDEGGVSQSPQAENRDNVVEIRDAVNPNDFIFIPALSFVN